MSLIVVGSVAYDGVETPHGKVDRMLGGAATYIALAASYFTPVKIVAVVGDDFAQEDVDLLASRHIGLEGLERVAGGKSPCPDPAIAGDSTPAAKAGHSRDAVHAHPQMSRHVRT